MSGTVVICSTAILTVLLDEPWLADICILYALLSFIAVIVITKIYIGASIDKEQKEKEEKTDGDR
jgi:multicomponent Na+:H+ antiporter subunit F